MCTYNYYVYAKNKTLMTIRSYVYACDYYVYAYNYYVYAYDYYVSVCKKRNYEIDYYVDYYDEIDYYVSAKNICHPGWRTLILKCNKNNYDRLCKKQNLAHSCNMYTCMYVCMYIYMYIRWLSFYVCDGYL